MSDELEFYGHWNVSFEGCGKWRAWSTQHELGFSVLSNEDTAKLAWATLGEVDFLEVRVLGLGAWLRLDQEKGEKRLDLFYQAVQARVAGILMHREWTNP